MTYTPSKEAIEAAARAICAAQFPDVADTYAWNVQFEDGKQEYRAEATAALSAAGPIMRAEWFQAMAGEFGMWGRSGVIAANALLTRAAQIEEQPCCTADGDTCATCASYDGEIETTNEGETL